MKNVVIQSSNPHSPPAALTATSTSPRSLPVTTPVTIAISESRCAAPEAPFSQTRNTEAASHPYLIMVPNHANVPPSYDSDEASDMEIPPTPNSVFG